VLLGIVALILGASGWVGLTRHQEPAAAAPTAAPSPVTTTATAGAEPAATVPKDPDVRPTHLRIPAIGVSATVISLGIQPDRQVEVPENPDEVGWYRLGARPGQEGSAVLLGHVDSKAGPAVFHRLPSLEPGDEVEVVDTDGRATRFEVTSIATYANEDFPARKVYRPAGRPGLALVTCGGRYDAANGGYQSNVVVYADLAG
jgi:sortase (surface protein transpeptidase)